MKKLLLIIRLVSEATFGLISMTGLLLLPGIWRGTFPQLFILGYLGMPRRYHPYPPEFRTFDVVTRLGGWLGLAFVVLVGILCFKDVFRSIRRLR